MIKLSDFAKSQGVTNRAVQLALKRHEAELQGHFERKGQNGTWLDDYAEEFLRERMIQKAVIVYDESATPLLEENQRLRAEKEDLQKTLSAVYERLANVLEQSNAAQLQLQAKLSEQQLLTAEKEEAEMKIEALEIALEDERRISEFKEEMVVKSERRAGQAEQALKVAEEKIRTLEDVAEANGQEALLAKSEVEDLRAELDRRQAELDELKSRGWIARLFNKRAK